MTDDTIDNDLKELIEERQQEIPQARENLDFEPQASSNNGEKPEELSIEDRARQMGWRPKEQYYGDKNNWVDADQFVKNGSFFKKIDSLNQKLKQQDEVIRTINNQLSVTEQRAYKQALIDLENERKAAKSLHNMDALEQTYRKERELEKQFQPLVTSGRSDAAPPKVDPMQSPGFQEFKLKNPVMDRMDADSMAVKAYMTYVANEYEKANPGVDTDTVFKYVDKKVQEKMSHLLPESERRNPTNIAPKVQGMTTSKSSGNSAPVSLGDIDKILHTFKPSEQMVIKNLKSRGNEALLKTYLQAIRSNKQQGKK